MFMPSIDVGYECTESNDKRKISIENDDDFYERLIDEEGKKTNLYSLSIGELMCGSDTRDKNILEPSSLAIAFLPPGNIYNNVNAFKISRFTINTKLYSGHRLHCVDKELISQMKSKFISSFGHELDYEARCKVPPLNATLRLKINGIVRKFENKTEDNFGKKNIYTFDKREMRDASIGCHAVPDEMEHPAFSDFYELLYPTSLLMFDETTGKFIEVNNIENLVSNRTYKCIIKDVNSKNKKQNYIRETEFIINLTGDYSYIWIIFGVFIVVTALLIAGLIIFKRLQLKKKKRNNSLSTSSSQSTSTSSTVISKVSNIQIIQNKNVAAKSTNMGKTMVNKNANINNKVTNLEQKVATKNSNINLVNQAKNTPKKVVGKNSNQKKINNMEDSVFKVK
uniref:Peptidase S72 domain-containing protein n=1 Tax=Strongyloides papillosus TaxID=174720 RepID=A0A0N5B2R7_STREA